MDGIDAIIAAIINTVVTEKHLRGKHNHANHAGRATRRRARKEYTAKAVLLKTDGGAQYPASSYLVVEDPRRVSTWHLRVRDEDGEVDRRLMGAAWAALHDGYRGNVYEGDGKQEAVAALKKLYDEVGAALPTATTTAKSTVLAFKAANGTWRWIGVASSAHRDRDREIVSTKALHDWVATGQMPPLRFWHVDGLDFGDADYAAVAGPYLILSGTFRDQGFGEALAAKGKEYQMSVGFTHSPNEPDGDGVYHRVNIFEASIVPNGRAANPMTAFYALQEHS